MSQTLEFLGTWSPAFGSFPIVPSTVNNAYYFVSAPGVLNTFTFNAGDWLLYLEDANNPGTNTGTWYQTSGGMVQATVGQDVATVDPGTYPKVKVDQFGTVIAGYALDATDIPYHEQDAATIAGFSDAARSAAGQMFVTPASKAIVFTYDPVAKSVSADVKVDGLTIVKDRFGQLTVVGGPSGTTGQVVPSDIVGFADAVKAVIGADFFVNPTTSSVVFAYDTVGESVSADVKIDNSTIVKNRFGQLTSQATAAPHKHPITDIIGLNTNVLPAGQQPVGLPSDGAFGGLADLKSYTIADAFDLINDATKANQAATVALEASVAGLTPVSPPLLSALVLAFTRPALDVLNVEDGSVAKAFLDQTPVTTVTPRFLRSPGVLEAFVDSVLSGSVTIGAQNLTGVGQGVLAVIEDGDAYAGEPAFQGWWQSLRVQIQVLAPLTEGPHTISLVHSNGQTTTLAFNVVSDETTTAILMGGSVPITLGADTFLSGVPVLASPAATIGPLQVGNVAQYFYDPNDVVELRSPHTILDVVQAPGLPPAPQTYVELDTTTAAITLPSDFVDPVVLDYDVFAVSHRLVTTRRYTYAKRWDASIVLERAGTIQRVVAGPTDFDYSGASYNSTLDLSLTNELQIENRKIVWPTKDYSYLGGPDYSVIPTGSWRWITLVETIANSPRSHIDLNLAITHLTQMGSLKVYVKVGAGPFVDALTPWTPRVGGFQNGMPALDLRHSGRRLTFGPHLATGNALVVKIGFTANDFEVDIPQSFLA